MKIRCYNEESNRTILELLFNSSFSFSKIFPEWIFVKQIQGGLIMDENGNFEENNFLHISIQRTLTEDEKSVLISFIDTYDPTEDGDISLGYF